MQKQLLSLFLKHCSLPFLAAIMLCERFLQSWKIWGDLGGSFTAE